MYSRRSSVVFTYIICVRSTKAGTEPSSLPGLCIPPLPAGPWQVKQPSVAASRKPRVAGGASSARGRARSVGERGHAGSARGGPSGMRTSTPPGVRPRLPFMGSSLDSSRRSAVSGAMRRRRSVRAAVPTRTRGWTPLAVALTVLLALPARALDLGALLAGVATNERFDAPARADVRLTCEPGCQTGERRAIFLGKGDALYVEVEGGPRALVRSADILTPEGAAKPGAAIGDTDVLLEDLAPFTADSLKLPQISDEGPTEVVVTAAPSHPS